MWRARNQQADIIHIHDAEMLIVAVPAKLWWRGSKFVYDVHEDFPPLLLIRDWLPVFARPILKIAVDIIEKSLASFADAIVGVTAPLARNFNNATKVAIYNYPSRRLFDCAREVHVQPKNRKYDLVHLGTLSNQRAVFLAETIRTFHDMRPNSRSLVMGLTPEVRRLIESRVPDSCVLMDKIGHEEIPKILSECKVGINVHPWLGPHLMVALPVKACEYMACGCAVVSSTLPVLDEILNAGAKPMQEPLVTILQSKAPVDYARAVLRFVEAIDRGEDPGMRLRAFALSHMNWETEADKLAKLYLHLLGRLCVT
jgi:glycosyltransferase involved in cell wall biosynthesis